jgi:aspartate-semialdehyde dehydrogenase
VTTLALVNPTTLVGKELREALQRRRELWTEIRLVSGADDEVGTLTELGGAAAIVARAEDAELTGARLVFFCGDREATLPLLAALPAGATAILLGADATPDDGLLLVAGVNLDTLAGAASDRPLLSPHPGAVLLAHLLHPLRRFGVEEAVATLVQPVSMYGEPALDELYAQARRVIALAGQEPAEVLPGQLAFNAFPSHLPGGHVGAEVAAVLGEPALTPAVELFQGSIFHSFTAALYVRCRQEAQPEELREALGDHPFNRLADDAELLGPVDAAASDEVIVGTVRREPPRDGRPAGTWIWAVMDNLTRGGALNALAIAEHVLGR